MEKIEVCPSTLKRGFDTYSPEARRRLFDGRAVSHILPFDSPNHDSDEKTNYVRQVGRISLSGVQPKGGLVIGDNGFLAQPAEGQRSRYILKPVPSSYALLAREFCPANEHVTMQLAAQVYGIETADAESGHGVYFLRTNVRTFDEKTTWDYYNLIREIECTNRQLKTDLNLRPIYHQRDDRSDAYLFLGMLAYWVVNTIRHQLKGKGENAYWTEIVRRMSTQKLVTTTAFNALGEKVKLRQCSEPSKQAREIYWKLGYKEAPFRKMKICRSQRPPD